MPTLFDEEQSLFSQRIAERIEVTSARRGAIRKVVDRLLPSLDRNVSAAGNMERIGRMLREVQPNPVLLNIGDKAPSSASMDLRSDPAIDVVELDVRPSAITNVLADPIQLPFEDETFDCVIAVGVLEHIIDPIRCVAEIYRILKPGGLVYSDTPFILEVHAGAFDYQRFTAVGHRKLFGDFEELQSGITQGPGVALAHSLQSFMLSFVSRRVDRYAVKAFCRTTLFWLKYADGYLSRRPGANDAAMGTYFMGRKNGDVRSPHEILKSYAGSSPDMYPRRVVSST